MYWLTWAVFIFAAFFLVRRPIALFSAKLCRGVVARSGSHHGSWPTGGATQRKLWPRAPMSINYRKENTTNEKSTKIETNHKYILKRKTNDHNHCILILLPNFVLLKKYLQIDISNLTKLVYYVTRYINSWKDNSKISSQNLGIWNPFMTFRYHF